MLPFGPPETDDTQLLIRLLNSVRLEGGCRISFYPAKSRGISLFPPKTRRVAGSAFGATGPVTHRLPNRQVFHGRCDAMARDDQALALSFQFEAM